MSEPENWQASLLEQRMAWGIAACCLILVLLASTRPEWFDFSGPQQQAVTKQTTITPAKHSLPAQRKTHHKTRAKPHSPAAGTAHATHPTPSPPVEKHPATAAGFYVQLGAFQERPRARGLADQLKRKGFSAVIASKKDGLHAVWVGPRKTRIEAEKLLKSIRNKLKKKGFIVHKKQA